jgi:hypothetical protein
MHWAQINCELYKAGSSPSQIGTETGYAASRVARIIRGIERNFTIASAISKTTGISVNKLFPNGNYEQCPGRIRRDRSTSKAA